MESGHSKQRKRVKTQAAYGPPSDSCSEWSHHRRLQGDDLDAEWQAFIHPGVGCLHQPQQQWQQQQQEVAGPGPSSTAASAYSANQFTGSRTGGIAPTVRSLDDWDFADEDLYTPYPSNTPVNEGGGGGGGTATMTGTASDCMELWTLADRVPLPAGPGQWEGLTEVFVILFGVGQSETEGIYSLRAANDDGMPTETIIAFESEDDAQRYAVHLEATMLPMMEHAPMVCSIPPTELLSFCEEAGYCCSLEAAGSLLIPPDYNVGITDWERSLRLREGRFSVLEADPELTSTMNGSWDDLRPEFLQRPDTPTPSAGSSSNMLRLPNELVPRLPAEFSEGELASIRAKLEALLPEDGGHGDGDLPPCSRVGM